MTRSLLPSHPDYPEIDRLSNMLAVATNAHMHSGDMAGAERAALIETLADALAERLEVVGWGTWAKVINKIDKTGE